MAVRRDCPGCPGGPGHLSGACTAGPNAGLQQTPHARLANPALRRPCQVPAGPVRSSDVVRSHAVCSGHTLAFTFAASRWPVTVLRHLATTALTAVRNGWCVSKTPRGHFPVLRADTKQHHGAYGLPTSDPRPPAALPGLGGSDSRRPTRATRPAAVPSLFPQPPPAGPGDRDARASSPLPERRSPQPWPSAARSGPGSRRRTQAGLLGALRRWQTAVSRCSP